MALQNDVASVAEDAQDNWLNDIDFASRKAEEASLRRYDAAGWLRNMVGILGKDFPAQPPEEEFRIALRSGIILCNVLNRIQPGAVPKVVEAPSDAVVVPDGAALRSFQYFENVRNFLDSIEEMGIPGFEASDLEQGGKSSRIVNCVLAMKSYNDWKEGGGKGFWKFSGNSKPPSGGKQFVRKNTGLFMNSLSRNSSTVEKAFDSLLIDQNSVDDLEVDLHEMDNSDPLHKFVRQQLSDKKREDIPLIVENILSKVMEGLELRLESENEQAGMTSRDVDVPSPNTHVNMEQVPSRDMDDPSFNKHVEEEPGMTLRDVDIPSSREDVELEAGTNLRERDFPSPHKPMEVSNLMEDFKDDIHDRKSKQLALKRLKRQNLVEYHQRSIQELKSTLDCTKQDLQMLSMRYQEEVQNLGKHLIVLANAAARYQKVLVENRKLYNQVQDLKGNIRVYCRIRPNLPGQPTGLSIAEAVDEQTLSVLTPAKNGKVKKFFTFTKVFSPSASQEDIFSDTQPLIRSVLDGYNVCILAYGQTGSGKTYTMTGPKELTAESLGVNYRALSDLFSISEQRKDSISYNVAVQMIEIYNEQVRDLLVNDDGIFNNPSNGTNAPDAKLVPVRSTSDVINLMNLGCKNRAVGCSRSHSCVTVHVQGRNLTSGKIVRGCMHLVDLAGSEVADQTDAVDDNLKESQLVNRSLSALGDVLSSLARKQSHVPYKNSKLTQLLQDSLGGQAKTLMFIHISPEADALGETISTLKFAERISAAEFGGRSGKDSTDVRELKGQIASLKAALLRKEKGESGIQQLRSISPDRVTVGSIASSLSLSPSWKSTGDVSIAEGQSDLSSISRMQSFDPQDLINSPPWPAVSNSGSLYEDKCHSGDWVDKDMVNYNTSKVYPEQQLQKASANRSLGNGLSRTMHDTIDTDYQEAETSDSSELDYRLQINVSKSANTPTGGGLKAKKLSPKQTTGPEIRSLIPPPPTRRGANGSHSPLQKSGKKSTSADGKRKPAVIGK